MLGRRLRLRMEIARRRGLNVKCGCAGHEPSSLDQDSGAQATYQIVGEDEADIKEGKISVNSPIARALIGKFAGDIAQVVAPGGLREYEVLDVRYE